MCAGSGICATVTTPSNAAAQNQILSFSGYTWRVRSGYGGPGPNDWDTANVWLDKKGYMHLKISKVDGRWRCAEVETTQHLGFGRYQFQVIGALDRLDRNVVLGLFNYPTQDIGVDASNEIDIEFANWGNPDYPPGNYTVWAAEANLKPRHYAFDFSLPSATSTHRFTWTKESVYFQSLSGRRNNNLAEFAHWTFHPKAYEQLIPQNPLPIHINLWLYQGQEPTDNQPVEIVIKQFSFIPE
ncbi:MAG: hypothetical protein EPN17_02285 [Methylobacter sp.]|nr:MAG: hypothetical protein EPN17_02285 [Methylobacter sp.]